MIRIPKSPAPFLVPAGMHTAVCYIVADLGTQESSFSAKQCVHISWELPEEKLTDGRPAVIGRRYNLSVGPKSALRGDLEGWLGRDLTPEDLDDFDMTDLVGQTCQVNVKHSANNGDRIYANVASVLPPPKGAPKRRQTVNGPVAFSLQDQPFDRRSYEALPEWLQTVIAKSPEYQAAVNPEKKSTVEQLQAKGFDRGQGGAVSAAAEMADDDLPFLTCDPTVEPYLKRRIVA